MKHKVVLHTILDVEKRVNQQKTQLYYLNKNIHEMTDEKVSMTKELTKKRHQLQFLKKDGGFGAGDTSSNEILTSMEHLAEYVLYVYDRLQQQIERKTDKQKHQEYLIDQYENNYMELQQRFNHLSKKLLYAETTERMLNNKLKHKNDLLKLQMNEKKKIMKLIQEKNQQIKACKSMEKARERRDEEDTTYMQEPKNKKIDDKNKEIELQRIMFEWSRATEPVNKCYREFDIFKNNAAGLLKKIEAKVEKLSDALETCSDTNKGWWAELWNIWGSNKDDEYQENINKLKTDIQELKAEFSHCRNIFNEMNNHISKNQEKDIELMTALHDLSETMKSYQEKEKDYYNKESDMKKAYQTQVEQIDEKYQELEQRYTALEKMLDQYKGKETQYKEEIDALTKQWKKEKSAKEQLQIKQQNLEKDGLKTKDYYEEKIKNFQNQITDYEKTINTLKKQLDNKNKSIKSLQAKQSQQLSSQGKQKTSEQPNIEDYYNIPLPSSSQTTVFNPYKYSNREKGGENKNET